MTECEYCGEKFKSTVHKDGSPRARFCPDKNCKTYWHREQERNMLLLGKKVTTGVVTN